MGEGDELHLIWQSVVRRARARIEPPDDHKPLDVRSETGEEEGEGALGIDGAALAPVDVVRVDGEPHGRRYALPRRRTIRARAASGGPKRTEPTRNPNPQDPCMTA